LFETLAEHPSICEATLKEGDPEHFTKEVHFFDLNYRFKEGPEFYCSYFQECNNHAKRFRLARSTKSITGQNFIHADFTPGYLDYKTASRMKATFPPSARKKMKMIAVLREPVRRTLSWYNHIRSLDVNPDDCPDPEEKLIACQRLIRKNFKKPNFRSLSDLRPVPTKIAQGEGLSKHLSFEEFVVTDNSTIARSRYLDILKEYYSVFPMENILILNFDWMMEHQGRTMKVISEFIGINNIWNPDFLFPIVNENEFGGKKSLEDIDCDIVKELDDFYKPYNNELYKFLRENSDKSWHGQPYFRRFKDPNCEKYKST